MKLVNLILLIPFILIAQSAIEKSVEKIDFEKDADWLVPSDIGIILDINGDSINYEEAWMRIIPNRTVITDKSGKTLSLENLQAPCKVEISYFGKGKHKFIISIKLLKQLQYTSDRYIIGDETIIE
ncbi:MAG: hypothetical protein ACUVQT_02950 [bacterium]